MMEKNWHKWGHNKIRQLLTQEHATESQWTEIVDFLCQGVDRRELPLLLAWLQQERTTFVLESGKPDCERHAGEGR